MIWKRSQFIECHPPALPNKRELRSSLTCSRRLSRLETAVLALLSTAVVACGGSDEEYSALDARLKGKTVLSSFSDGADGWRVTDASRRVSSIPSLNQSGPSDEAYLEAANYWEQWYWRAPAAFHGNLCAYFGGHLSFRMRQWVNNRSNLGGELFESMPNELESMPGGQLILEGRGSQLVFQLSRLPGTEWTTYEVPLEPGPGWQGKPSESDFMIILANVTSLLIQGNPFETADVEALDAVSLTKPSRITGLFSSTAACDEQEVRKTVRLLLAEEPFEPLDSFQMGMSFIIEVTFEEPNDNWMEPVTITNRSTGAEYGYEAVRYSGDSLVFRTPLISTQVAEEGKP